MVEVTRSAEEAETIKEEVEKVRDKAQALVDDIAKDKSLAEEKLEAARPALEEAEEALNTIKPAHIGEDLYLYGFGFCDKLVPFMQDVSYHTNCYKFLLGLM